MADFIYTKGHTMRRSINVISLFSGCGGLDLGLEGGFTTFAKSVKNEAWIDQRAGEKFVRLRRTSFRTVFACDIRPSAKIIWERVFKRDNVFHLESIVDLVKKARSGQFQFPDADVVTGGFPCQDFSVAGKRNGFDSHKSHNGDLKRIDEPTEENRGMLYFWMREVINIVRPKIFIAENVKGLISLGDAKNIIADDFRNVGGGYIVVEPQVLHAGEYGVPQSRERVVFIGIRKDAYQNTLNPYPKATHDLSNGVVTVRDAIFDLPEPRRSADPAHKAFSGAKWYGRHCQGQVEINPDGLGPTIRSEHHGNIEFRRLSRRHGGRIAGEGSLPERRLSVRECARLQTFPDEFDFVVDGVSASEAYKLIGNAVPPLMAYHIAMRIETIWKKLFDEKTRTQVSGQEQVRMMA